MEASNTDPIRDLNNFLQRQPGPGGNMSKDFKWSFVKEGPEHDALYHVIQGIVFRSLLYEAPLEVLGHVPPWPRLSLQEVVKISNGVCVRGFHERISNNLLNRSTLTAE